MRRVKTGTQPDAASIPSRIASKPRRSRAPARRPSRPVGGRLVAWAKADSLGLALDRRSEFDDECMLWDVVRPGVAVADVPADAIIMAQAVRKGYADSYIAEW